MNLGSLEQLYPYIVRRVVIEEHLEPTRHCPEVQLRLWLEEFVGEQAQDWDWCIEIEFEHNNAQSDWFETKATKAYHYIGFKREQDLLLFEISK